MRNMRLINHAHAPAAVARVDLRVGVEVADALDVAHEHRLLRRLRIDNYMCASYTHTRARAHTHAHMFIYVYLDSTYMYILHIARMHTHRHT